MLLDEPFDGLDAESATAVFQLLKDHADSGVPVLFTTDKWRLAQEHADDLIVLSHGRLLAEGTLDSLQGDTTTYSVRYADAAAADAAVSTLEDAGATDVVVDADTVAFGAVAEDEAVAAVRATEGVRAFGPVKRDLADLFKESV